MVIPSLSYYTSTSSGGRGVENPSSALTEYTVSVVVLSGTVLVLFLLVESVMLTLDLTEVGLAFGASSQSVSDSDSELESEVAPSLLWALASGRLNRPVPKN